MSYDEMDSANQANCDRIAATLLSGALIVAAIGTTVGLAGIKSPGTEWKEGLPECVKPLTSNCVTTPDLIFENGMEERV
jgi:hypothetical protein